MKLIEGLIGYLECPPQEVTFFKVHAEKYVPTTLADALQLHADTYLYLGLGINLYEDLAAVRSDDPEVQKAKPPRPFLCACMVKKIDGGFYFKIKHIDEEFTVDPTRPEDFEAVYASVFSNLLAELDSHLQSFLNRTSERNRIGFDVGRDEE